MKRQKEKNSSNFCACIIKANNKEKKNISIICSSCAQKQNFKMKLSELWRKIKTSWFLSDFGPFLYCWISCTNKVHHHHLGHISDVLLNITRIFPHLNTAWQRNSSVGSFCASSSASAHALFWGKHNHTKYLHFLIIFRYTFQLLSLNGKWTQLLSCHFINLFLSKCFHWLTHSC